MENKYKKLGEILIIKDYNNYEKIYNKLNFEEKYIVYHLQNASYLTNYLYMDQVNYLTIKYYKCVKYLVNKYIIKMYQKDDYDVQFLNQLFYLFNYLHMNNGQYLKWKHYNEKFTPETLGLNLLTVDRFKKELENTKYYNFIIQYGAELFDKNIDPTLNTDKIETSANNFYAKGLTTDQIIKLGDASINGYVNQDLKVEINCAKGRNSNIFLKIIKCFNNIKVVLNKSNNFSQEFKNSIDLLIEYLTDGNEEKYKEHSKEWLKITDTMDYSFGNIETYMDPLGHKGSYQAEVLYKTKNMNDLSNTIKKIELLLPYDDKYKILDNKKVYNTSIAYQMFGGAFNYVISSVSAYCLPNYDEIRQTFGSKQIIYDNKENMREIINKKKWIYNFFTEEEELWHNKWDPDYKIIKWIWTVQCILHETIGHGSGKILVAYKDLNRLLFGYEQALEELRAEIIALYGSVYHYDDLSNMFENFKNIPKEEIIKKLITRICYTGLLRLTQQSNPKTIMNNNKECIEVQGEHSLANVTIMNYLIKNKGIKIVKYDMNDRHVIAIDIDDYDKCLLYIKKLVIKVQTIKSTGNGIKVKKLIETYGRYVEKAIYDQLIINDRKVINGTEATAYLKPILVMDKSNNINMYICDNFAEQCYVMDNMVKNY
jgi:dipeptidyl-peptidase-3